MADILFHPEAQTEYDSALAWYYSRSPQAAARFEMEIERVLALILADPGSYPKYDDEHRFALLRRYPYCLIFQERGGLIYVVVVAHTSRRPGYWQGRT